MPGGALERPDALPYPQRMTTATPLLIIYQLPIVLRGISPLIWRRVLVHSHTTLAHLHTILQILFAWSDEHLHSFHIHGREYGSSGAPTHGVLLRDLCLHRGERFRYVYDFGAYWECDIRLEALLPVLLAALRTLGDAPARSLAALAQRLGVSEADAATVVARLAEEAAPWGAAPDSPLLPRTGRNGASSAPKMLLHRKKVIVARKETTPSKMSCS